MKTKHKKINKYMISYKIKKKMPKIIECAKKLIITLFILIGIIVVPTIFSKISNKAEIEELIYSITSILVFIEFYDILINKKK